MTRPGSEARQTTLDANFLSLYFVFFAVPLFELVWLCNGLPPPVPVAGAIALDAFAIILSLRLKSPQISPPFKRAMIVALAGLVLACLAVAAPRHELNKFPATFCVFFAMLAIPALAVSKLARISVRYQRLPSFLAGMGALAIGAACAAGMLHITVQYLPLVYDPVLYRINHILRIDDVSVFVHLASARLLRAPLGYCYDYLPVAILLAATSEFLHAPDRQPKLILQFLVVAAIGYPLYFLMPAVAPAQFFGELFPYHLPEAAAVARQSVLASSFAAFDPRNTMPSLHATWGFLALLALRSSPLWHRFLGVLLVLAFLIWTLGIGQHYAVDWIAALPLVLLVRGLCALSIPLLAPARREPICVGILLLCGWVCAIRLTPESLHFIWAIRTLALCSVIVPVWLELRLARAEGTSKATPRLSQLAAA